MERRSFLRLMASLGSLPLMEGCRFPGTRPRVAVVGAGYGGATCAQHILRLNQNRYDLSRGIEVALIDPEPTIVTCPFSNYVLSGEISMDDITWPRLPLATRVFPHSIYSIQAKVTGIDVLKKQLSLSNGSTLSWDRLVLSPGIDLIDGVIDGYEGSAMGTMPHAWCAGEQTRLLRRQLQSMDDGGTVVIAPPAYPYKCPPAPYERASLIAWYLQRHKKRSKILILDAKDSFTKKDLFQQGWDHLYPGMIEWVSGSQGGAVTAVNPETMEVTTKGGEKIRCALANIIPPQRAKEIAQPFAEQDGPQAGWCRVDPLTFESLVAPNVHILGDAIIAGDMPKSGFAANSQAKACAQAIVALFAERQPLEPILTNTCYSLLAPDYGISVSGTYRIRGQDIVALAAKRSESLPHASLDIRAFEAQYAVGWYKTMTSDIYGAKKQWSKNMM